MLQQVKKFRELSSEEKQLFGEAYLTLAVLRLTLLTVPFKHLTRSLEHHKELGELLPLNEREMRLALLVGKMIRTAAAYTPWESSCLVQSLTAQRMLLRRGIPGAFCLGVMKADGTEEMMKAHAWSQCGDKCITGGGEEEFKVLSVFKWGTNDRL